MAKVFIVCLIASSLINLCSVTSIDNDLPCDFLDSINITDGVEQPNKSIIFKGIEFPNDHYGRIAYVLNATERVPAESHLRGCPCIDKPCIRLCCPYKSFVKLGSKGESMAAEDMEPECIENELINHFEIPIVDENNEKTNITLDHTFGYVNRICQTHYMADNYAINKVICLWTFTVFFLGSKNCSFRFFSDWIYLTRRWNVSPSRILSWVFNEWYLKYEIWSENLQWWWLWWWGGGITSNVRVFAIP